MLEFPEERFTDQAAQDYLGSISLDRRRQNGQVYTPAHIVDFVLQQVRYVSAESIEQKTVLDPACGSGAFLVCCVSALIDRCLRSGLESRILELIESRIFGFDVDEVACELARSAVRRTAARAIGKEVPQPFFLKNVMCADFLLDTYVDSIAPVLAGGFDFIVGNPPYVSATRIQENQKRSLRARFSTATGRLDFYMLFMERALVLLKVSGRLAVITPDKFLLSKSAAALRGLLLRRNALRVIARFRSHRIFPAAATVPCVTVLERSAEPSTVKILECADQLGSHPTVEVVRESVIDQSVLTSAPWDLLPPDLLEFANRIKKGHPSLGACALRLSAGPATGKDSVFVLPEESEHEIEELLLRPALRGRDIGRCSIRDQRTRILIPYVFDKAGRSTLVNLAQFPKAKRYLESHRDVLQSRHCVRVWEKVWYDLHDQVLFDLALQPKIVVPDVAESNRFAFDPGRYFPLHSVYYLIPRRGVDPEYLTGVLNSAVAEFLVRLLAPVVKDGFSRYRQQFLVTLPIPEADTRRKESIVHSVRRLDISTMNEVVASLFRLSDADREAIEQFLTKSRLRSRTHDPRS